MAGCDAAADGYTCVGSAGHGDIHVSPEQLTNPRAHGNGWIFEPRADVAELTGRAPMSGYRLLSWSEIPS